LSREYNSVIPNVTVTNSFNCLFCVGMCIYTEYSWVRKRRSRKNDTKIEDKHPKIRKWQKLSVWSYFNICKCDFLFIVGVCASLQDHIFCHLFWLQSLPFIVCMRSSPSLVLSIASVPIPRPGSLLLFFSALVCYVAV